MASQSVLELAVNTGKWDAGLKKAKSALDNFTQTNGGLQQALEKDGKSMQTFVQMMGKMDSTAKTAKGQMSDYRSTIEQLTMQYNRMTEAQQKSIGQDYLHAIDQLKQKYQAVNDEIQEMNRGLSSTKIPDAGGIGNATVTASTVDPFGNLTSKFTKANIYAMAAEKGVEAMQQLGSHIADVMKQSQQMSIEAEGIRRAFERLNRPDLLDKLKEATHGTVSELDLMKQAVKFSDFRLNLDEMGTLLAFAQKKAKDTGQSVDYMVDSIVTGLGRKSLMILDNLGLSAAEIKEHMKGTGDMTKAVAEIIEEQMSEAGEYVETASDRMARGIADNQNAMLKLGDTMREAFGDTGLEEVVNILEGKLISDLTDLVGVAGQVKDIFNDILGTDSGLADMASTIYDIGKELYFVLNPLMEIYRIYQKLNPEKFGVIGGAIGNIVGTKPVVPPADGSGGSGNRKGTQKKAKQTFEPDSIAAQEQYINELRKKWKEAGDDVRDLYLVQLERAQEVLKQMQSSTVSLPSLAKVNGVSAFKVQLDDPIKRAQETLKNTRVEIEAEIKADATKVDTATLHTLLKDSIQSGIDDGLMNMTFASIGDQIAQGINVPDEAWQKILDQYNDLRKKMGMAPISIDLKSGSLETGEKENGSGKSSTLDSSQKLISGLSSVSSGLQQMGVKLPDSVQKVLGGIQGLMTVIQGVQSIISVFSTTTATAQVASVNGNTVAMSALTSAIIANTAAVTTNTLTPSVFAAGGIVHAAGGFRVPGRSFSGDNIPAMLDSGELVLNKAQQGVIAHELQQNNNYGGGGGRDFVSGQNIFLGTNNYLRGSGQGELVTTKMLRQMGLK